MKSELSFARESPPLRILILHVKRADGEYSVAGGQIRRKGLELEEFSQHADEGPLLELAHPGSPEPGGIESGYEGKVDIMAKFRAERQLSGAISPSI